jgi:hypothetical protein
MIYAVWRFDCIGASTMIAAPTRRAAPLVVLIESLVESPRVCLMRGCPIIFLLVLRWSATVRINAVHWLRLAMLVFIVVRFWGFVRLWNFSLLLKLVKVLNLRLAKFCELFVEVQHCFGPLSD